jgi:hypothetical protein
MELRAKEQFMPPRTLIVYIDPEFRTYLPSFEPAAKSYRFRLSAVDSLAEGIKVIENHRSVIRAVILALATIEVNIDAKQALPRIKNIEPGIRIVILDSDASCEKLGDWFEYSKLGASMCFSKRWLDPMNLFSTIRDPMRPWIETQKYENLFHGRQHKPIIVATTKG